MVWNTVAVERPCTRHRAASSMSYATPGNRRSTRSPNGIAPAPRGTAAGAAAIVRPRPSPASRSGGSAGRSGGDTSPRSGERRDATLRSARDSPGVVVPERRPAAIASRITAGSASPGRPRAPASTDAARRTLATTADQLLANARAACLRDAVPASKQELVARIGRSQAEVAENLWRNRRGTRPIPRTHADDAMIALAATILGRREHTVFLARHNAPPNDAHTPHQLATQLGASIERIYQLEASALHKRTTALRCSKVRALPRTPPGDAAFWAPATGTALGTVRLVGTGVGAGTGGSAARWVPAPTRPKQMQARGSAFGRAPGDSVPWRVSGRSPDFPSAPAVTTLRDGACGG